MESSEQPAPLPRSYDDGAVFLLEPLHDSFLARELEQRRFSKAQEREWTTRIAQDVQHDERAVCTPCRLLFLYLYPSAHKRRAHLQKKKRPLDRRG